MNGPFQSDVLADRANIMGSEALLRALWRHHPAILRNLAARGNSVAQREIKP